MHISHGQMQNLIEGRAMAHNTQIYLANHAFYVVHVIKLLIYIILCDILNSNYMYYIVHGFLHSHNINSHIYNLSTFSDTYMSSPMTTS